MAKRVWYLEFQQIQKMFSLLGRSSTIDFAFNVKIDIRDLSDWTFFYKNIEFETNQNFMKVLRAFLVVGKESDKYHFFL